MPVRLNSSGGGSVTLDVPATASAFNLNLPAANGSLGINLGTAQNSTSGTAIDFTGIPAGVRRVTVNLSGVSTNGTSPIIVQLGAGSFVTSGYSSYASRSGASTLAGTTFTAAIAGINVFAATNTAHGVIFINALTNLIWAAQGGGFLSSTDGWSTGGGITLGGALDRIRITTANGTDTFDAGSINIAWEF